MDLIVVIQNEPRDGDIVYLEKDLEAFRNRVQIFTGIEVADTDDIDLGVRYHNEWDMSHIIGYEVNVPEQFFKDGE